MTEKREKLVLSAIFLFSLAIRLAFLDQKNLWFDEVFSWNISSASFYEILVRTINDIHPPLYYFILKLWMYVAGDSVFALRLLSALASGFAVFPLYGISKRFIEKPYSFIPVLLFCISPLNLYYSQEVRMAAMNLLFNLAAVYYFIRLLEEDPDTKSRWNSVLFILFETFALYTHYFSFFVLAGMLTYLVFTNGFQFRKYKPFVFRFLAVLIFYAGWIPASIIHLNRGQSWRQGQTLSQVANEVLNYIKDTSLGLYYHYSNLEYIKYISWFLFALMLFVIILSFFRRPAFAKIHYSQLIAFVLLVPLVIAISVSFNQKIEFYRYLSILIPFFCICLVYQLIKIKPRIIAITLIMLFASINTYGIYMHYSNDFKNNDYRQVIRDLNSDYSEGERIYVQPHYCGWIIDYTKKQENLKIPNFTEHKYDWNKLVDTLRIENPKQFWVVMDYSAVDTTEYKNYVNELKSNYSVISERQYQMAPARVVIYHLKKENPPK